jgi:hypothetical protein
METHYQHMLDALEAARVALPEAMAPVLPSEIVRWTRELPFHEIRSADAVADRFSETRVWPEMSNNVLAQMHLRVEAAIDLCRGMLKLEKPPMPFPENEACRSLLVHYWHSKGPEWVEYRYGGQAPLGKSDPKQN